MQMVAIERRNPASTRFQEFPMKEEHLARKLKFEKEKRIGDIVMSSPNGILVSKKVKDIIEQVDPKGEGHRLFPVQILHKDGTPYDGEYFSWNIHRKLAAMDETSPGLNPTSPDELEHSFFSHKSGVPTTRDNLSVKRDVIEDTCAWFDPRGIDVPFISDKLLDAFRSQGVTGFDAGAEYAEVSVVRDFGTYGGLI